MGGRKAAALLSAYAAAATVIGTMLAAPLAGADGTVDGVRKPVVDQGGAVLSQINATRAANGCGPVAANPQLTASAARQANDMLATGVQGHVGSDGSTLAQRAVAAGYSSYSKLGEIVFSSAGPGSSAASAVAWWMTSPRHRAIITDCTLTEAGFSAVSSGDKVAVAGDFGTR